MYEHCPLYSRDELKDLQMHVCDFSEGTGMYHYDAVCKWCNRLLPGEELVGWYDKPEDSNWHVCDFSEGTDEPDDEPDDEFVVVSVRAPTDEPDDGFVVVSETRHAVMRIVCP